MNIKVLGHISKVKFLKSRPAGSAFKIVDLGCHGFGVLDKAVLREQTDLQSHGQTECCMNMTPDMKIGLILQREDQYASTRNNYNRPVRHSS